jgi:hypothetical protein
LRFLSADETARYEEEGKMEEPRSQRPHEQRDAAWLGGLVLMFGLISILMLLNG